MPTFYLTKQVTKPEPALEHMGLRLDLSMELTPAAEEEEAAPSSSSQPEKGTTSRQIMGASRMARQVCGRVMVAVVSPVGRPASGRCGRRGNDRHRPLSQRC